MLVSSVCLSILLILSVLKIFSLIKNVSSIERDFQALQHDLDRRIALARTEAVEKSRNVLKGQISEHLAPYLPDFLWEASDCKFLGQPIDLIIFKGRTKGEIEEIIFVDVKTGESKLSKVQRNIKDCILNGKVSFQTWRHNK